MKQLLLALTSFIFSISSFAQNESTRIPITGATVLELKVFDKAVTSLMEQHDIPGASLAISYNGKLVFARGYGYSEISTGKTVKPKSIFRIASISKPITAVGIMKLIEEEKLKLEDKPFEILNEITVPEGYEIDPRLNRITIHHLLNHSGGFNRNKDFDPMHVSVQIANGLGVEPPANVDQIIRFMLTQPLDFDPGTDQIYSNFGYAVLGRVIEKIMGQPYETYIKKEILNPVGIQRMKLGQSLKKHQSKDEVSYYRLRPPKVVPSVYSKEEVPYPYGGFNMEVIEANGGWIASTIDLLRFMSAVDGLDSRPDIINRETAVKMATPPENISMDKHLYGLGWYVEPSQGNDKKVIWHSGDQPGTTGLLWASGEIQLAFLINRSPWDQNSHIKIRDVFEEAIDSISEWPTHDLFKKYP